jgi:hypothetical protein
VGNDADKVGFTDGGDLHHLRDAAHVRQRGAYKVDGVIFDQLIEVPSVSPFLACGQGNIDFAAQDGEVLLKGFRAHRVFHEEGSEVFNRVAAANGIGQVETLMEVDAPVAIFADTFPHLGALSAHDVDALAGVIRAVRRRF